MCAKLKKKFKGVCVMKMLKKDSLDKLEHEFMYGYLDGFASVLGRKDVTKDIRLLLCKEQDSSVQAIVLFRDERKMKIVMNTGDRYCTLSNNNGLVYKHPDLPGIELEYSDSYGFTVFNLDDKKAQKFMKKCDFDFKPAL